MNKCKKKKWIDKYKQLKAYVCTNKCIDKHKIK